MFLLVFVTLEQGGVIWKRVSLTWPVGMFLKAFSWQLIDAGGLSLL